MDDHGSLLLPLLYYLLIAKHSWERQWRGFLLPIYPGIRLEKPIYHAFSLERPIYSVIRLDETIYPAIKLEGPIYHAISLVRSIHSVIS